MTTPTPREETALPDHPERHETTDGTVYWGDVPAARFEAAAEKFPVLKYVIEEYFGSPEREAKDSRFVARYAKIGEDSAEFNGFLEDLDGAIRQYVVAASLVNGLMGIEMSSGEVRTQLASLKDQVLQQGDFDPEPEEEGTEETKDDRFLVQSAPERMQATFLRKREIPIGPLKGRPQPVIYYFFAGVALVLVGLLISFIPYVGGLGSILMLLGGTICFLLAVGILAMRKEYMHPEEAEEREEAKREAEERKKDKPGFFARHNPFTN